MDTFLHRLATRPPGARRLLLLAVVLVPFAVLAAASVFLPVAAPLVGALAGSTLFVAGYGYWDTLLAPEQRAALDLKARFPLNRRRVLIGVALAVWVLFLLILGSVLPAPILGTLNVTVALTAFTLAKATPEEAAEQAAAQAAAEAAAEAAAQPPAAPSTPHDSRAVSPDPAMNGHGTPDGHTLN